jgi:primosomal protein N' (replication factor Y)
MYADVLVEVNILKDTLFTYKVPSNISVIRGVRVYVPFGPREIEGFVIKVHNNKPDFDTKDIIRVVDKKPVLTEELFKIGDYISKKTLSSLILSYQTMLPVALKANYKVNVKKKYETYIKLIDYSYEGKNDRQKEIIKKLKRKDILKSILNKISASAVNTLIKNKAVEEYKKEVYRTSNNYIYNDKKVVLNEEQTVAVNKVLSNKNSFIPYLLYGVTGSGKTEVYMNIIENIIKDKKTAIVLVPEISLTPQMVNVFKSRFKEDIAILHSRLSAGEKYDEWRKIEDGEVNIVIGARSAIFAPLNNLGVIIIDESHSQTYKQENNPMYHAIDIALFRGKYNNCPVILGSATPSIESYTRAKSGIYKLLTLENRINKVMPKVEIVNMREETKKGNSIISSKLDKSIKEELNKGNQIIILLNRRGYKTVTRCPSCGYTFKCPNCDIPLIYHKSSNHLRCHYCGYAEKKVDICPECHSKVLNDYGMGTEKLEEEINKRYSAKVVRMDLDTTTRKGSHEKIINDFKKHKYDILIGTQMISKGLDFDDVTLVGVINGDASLNIPDFRSSEYTFQLLSQVSGRAGRSEKEGKVIIQVFDDTHYSINHVKNHDYKSFYNEEMKIRKILKYPPYSNICLIKIKGKDSNKVFVEANKITDHLKNKTTVTVLGPVNAAMFKMNNIYQVNIILKYKYTKPLLEPLIFIKNKYNRGNIKVDIDFNPVRL